MGKAISKVRLKMIIKKLLVALLGLLLVSIILGIIFEKQAKQQALIEFPPSGTLVDIGGRSIHLDCRGQGSPIVVFESGLDTSGSLSWSLVHNEIAKTTRACAYDRAGMMWSDPRAHTTGVFGRKVANDLNQALINANEQPPYVLVGHSFGGPYITLFTKYFGEKVAGLVFVDTSHPDQVTIMEDFKEPWFSLATYAVMDFFEPAWSYVGLTRYFAHLNTAKDTGQSQYDADAIDAFSPLSGEALTQESQFYQETLIESGTYRDFGDRPLVVIGAIADFEKISTQELEEFGLHRQDVPEIIKRQVAMHTEKATWSTKSKLNILYNTEHYVQFEKPAVVINAINSVVKIVRVGD